MAISDHCSPGSGWHELRLPGVQHLQQPGRGHAAQHWLILPLPPALRHPLAPGGNVSLASDPVQAVAQHTSLPGNEEHYAQGMGHLPT